MALRSDDKIAIVKTTGGGKQEEFTLDELNTFISTEEDARVTALETKINNMQYPEIVTIDLSTGNDYTIPTDAPPSFIVVTNTDGSDGDIFLPPATGSLNKITISIQKAANNIVVNPAAAPGTDTINLASSLTA